MSAARLKQQEQQQCSSSSSSWHFKRAACFEALRRRIMAHLATAGYHLQPRGTSSSRTGMLQSPVICRPSVPSSITCRRAFSNIRATSAVAEATTVEGPKRRRRRAPVSSQPDSSDTPTLGISEAGPSTDGDRSPATGTVTVTAAATAWVGSRANNNNNSASSATTDAADVHTRNSPRDNASVAPPHASSQQVSARIIDPRQFQFQQQHISRLAG